MRYSLIFDTGRRPGKQRVHGGIVRPSPRLRNTSRKVILRSGFLFEQGFKLGTSRCRSGFRSRSRLSLAFREGKEVTKVPGFFIQDSVGLWFAARIGRARIVESTVATTAQIHAAPRTRLPPPDPILNEDFPLALITGFHRYAPGSALRDLIVVQTQEEVNLLEEGR